MSTTYFTPFYLPKTVALIGMMGVGKSTVGSRLAKKLGKPFFDSDQRIQMAAGGHGISDIYEEWGEEAFRDTEFLVIQGILDTKQVGVLSTGEGAFIEPRTRYLLQDKTITVWLKSSFATLLKRVTESKSSRPQLHGSGDIETRLKTLIEARYPIYEFADVCVETDGTGCPDTVELTTEALKQFSYPAGSPSL